jgi:hypothetical protein
MLRFSKKSVVFMAAGLVVCGKKNVMKSIPPAELAQHLVFHVLGTG